jgi:hypothetical protein
MSPACPSCPSRRRKGHGGHGRDMPHVHPQVQSRYQLRYKGTLGTPIRGTLPHRGRRTPGQGVELHPRRRARMWPSDSLPGEPCHRGRCVYPTAQFPLSKCALHPVHRRRYGQMGVSPSSLPPSSRSHGRTTRDWQQSPPGHPRGRAPLWPFAPPGAKYYPGRRRRPTNRDFPVTEARQPGAGLPFVPTRRGGAGGRVAIVQC